LFYHKGLNRDAESRQKNEQAQLHPKDYQILNANFQQKSSLILIPQKIKLKQSTTFSKAVVS